MPGRRRPGRRPAVLTPTSPSFWQALPLRERRLSAALQSVWQRACLLDTQIEDLVFVIETTPSAEILVGIAWPETVRRATYHALLPTLRTIAISAARLDGQHLAQLFGAEIQGKAVQKAEAGLTLRFDQVDELAVQWARQHALKLVTGLTDDVVEVLRQELLATLQGHFTPRGMARRIRDMLPLTPRLATALSRYEARLSDEGLTGPALHKAVEKKAREYRQYRASVIARTESIMSMNSGRQLMWEHAVAQGLFDENQIRRRWVTTLDDRTEEDCLSLNGIEVRLREPFPSGIFHPPLHPQCVLGETQVTPGGPITAQTERWYEGETVTLFTASGRHLRATPNHPVLSRTGWVAVGLLKQGDHVIRDLSREWGALLLDDDVKDRPPTMEEIAETMLLAHPTGTVEVPISGQDFHGDGAGSEVAVIRADSKLWGALNPAGGQCLDDLSFVGSDVASVSLARQGLAGLGLVSPATTQGLRPAQLSHEREVFQGSGAEMPRFGAGAGHTGSTDVLEDRGVMDAELASYLISGQAGLVESDEIVEIHREHFSGLVYNLQTSEGWYIANGIVTHNCRCTVLLVQAQAPSVLIPPTPPPPPTPAQPPPELPIPPPPPLTQPPVSFQPDVPPPVARASIVPAVDFVPPVQPLLSFASQPLRTVPWLLPESVNQLTQEVERLARSRLWLEGRSANRLIDLGQRLLDGVGQRYPPATSALSPPWQDDLSWLVNPNVEWSQVLEERQQSLTGAAFAFIGAAGQVRVIGGTLRATFMPPSLEPQLGPALAEATARLPLAWLTILAAAPPLVITTGGETRYTQDGTLSVAQSESVPELVRCLVYGLCQRLWSRYPLLETNATSLARTNATMYPGTQLRGAWPFDTMGMNAREAFTLQMERLLVPGNRWLLTPDRGPTAGYLGLYLTA